MTRISIPVREQGAFSLNATVTADDFGMSEAVNDEIHRLAQQELINAVSVIANAPCVASALHMSRDLPNVSYGVHLNLTEFRPVSRNPNLKPLLLRDEEFDAEAICHTPITVRLLTAVYEECAAQIEHCLSAGLHVSYLDSHHHIHMLPALFPVLKRLQWRFGIWKVRSSVNVYNSIHTVGRIALHKKRLWATALKLDGTTTTRYVANLINFHDLIATDTVFRWIDTSAHDQSIELIVHPGNRCDPDFEIETGLLRSGWLAQYAANSGASPNHAHVVVRGSGRRY